MKIRIINIIVFILLQNQLVFSQSSSLEDTYPTFHVICKNVEILSREIMSCRQVEMSKSRVLEILRDHDWGQLDIVVDKAYETPQLLESKREYISLHFGKLQYSLCMKNLISQRFDPFEIEEN